MNADIKILYEDTHIIVCAKPHGLAVQSKRPGTPDLEHMLLNHLSASASAKQRTGKTGKAPYLAVIHRLDQPVAGLLVFAKTPLAAKELNRQLTGSGFGKHYLALTDGIPSQEEGTLIDYLVKDGRTNTSSVCSVSTPGAKEARLHYSVISKEADQALLEVTLDTGRHHQIRVQLSHMGCPIVGDTKYNPSAAKKGGWQTLQLTAYKLDFCHPTTKKPLHFEIECTKQS